MSEQNISTFNLEQTYAFLEKRGTASLMSAEAFWKSVMSAEPQSSAAGREGWLVANYPIAQDTPMWEMHPSGDELLVMISGEMQVILEQAGTSVAVELCAGESCLVPQGIWHRLLVRNAGKFLGVTYGKGTQHRPR